MSRTQYKRIISVSGAECQCVSIHNSLADDLRGGNNGLFFCTTSYNAFRYRMCWSSVLKLICSSCDCRTLDQPATRVLIIHSSSFDRFPSLINVSNINLLHITCLDKHIIPFHHYFIILQLKCKMF